MPFRNLRLAANVLRHTNLRSSLLPCLSVYTIGWRVRNGQLPLEGHRAYYEQRNFDLRAKSDRWLRRNRPDPYGTLYRAIAEYRPDVKDQYNEIILEKSYILGTSRTYAPKTAPKPVQEAVLLWRPTSASLIAKVIRNSRLIAQIVAKQQGSKATSPTPDDDYLKLLFNKNERYLMSSKRMTLADLQEWADILLEPTGDRAAARLNDYIFGNTSAMDKNKASIVPVALVRALLSRRSLTAASVQTLLTCTWHMLRSRDFGTARAQQCWMIFHSFARVAQVVWHEGLPNIASLLIAFLPTTWTPPPDGEWQHVSVDEHVFAPNDHHREVLTAMFNDALAILSWAQGPNPFRSSIFEEKAQFMILSHMVRYSPPLHVDSTGLVALSKVQVRRERTNQEEEWAALQARSWPPYPKPKTAVDEDKGYAFGSSRAVRALQHMRQAGYAFPEWEEVVKVYAGWDKHLTPTIQTRIAFLSGPTAVRNSTEEYYWAAKVATTRDVREAWAVFLQYEDTQLPSSVMVYAAMIRKITEERRRVTSDVSRPSDDSIVSGSGKEVVNPATSPMQKIFVSTEPPSFMDFFWHVLPRHMTSIPWLRGLLLASSPSIDDAMTIWRESEHDLNRTSLARAASYEPSVQPRNVHHMPGMLNVEFHGVVELLCQHPRSVRMFHKSVKYWRPEVEISLFDKSRPATEHVNFCPPQIIAQIEQYSIWQAIHLVKSRQTTKARTWLTLLKGIRRLLYEVTIHHRPPAFWFFGEVRDILAHMQSLQVRLEPECFSELCHVVEKIGRSAQNWLLRHPYGDPRTINAAREVGNTGSMVLRKAFNELCQPTVNRTALENATQGTGAENWIPRTVNWLSPTLCQYYIRALAVFGDFEGLYTFSRWLVNNEADMAASLQHVKDGQQKWAVVVTAFRVAIDCPRVFFPNMPSETQKKPTPELAALIRQNLESMVELGGWASDQQVEDYQQFVSTNAALRQHQKMLEQQPDYTK